MKPRKKIYHMHGACSDRRRKKIKFLYLYLYFLPALFPKMMSEVESKATSNKNSSV